MATQTETADSAMDFDDLLDDVGAALEPGSAPVTEKKAEPKPAKPKTEPSKPAAAKRFRATAPAHTLFFDLETVPDYSREDLFGLPSIPTPATYAGENDGPAPSELVAGTEDEIKARVMKVQAGGKLLPRVILAAAVEFEKKRDKGPRKGVLSLLGGMIDAIDGEASRIKTATDSRRKTMAVTPEMNRIVAMGFAWADDVPMAMVYPAALPLDQRPTIDEFEKQLLTRFWEFVQRAKTIVGFNVLGFDLPTIFTRSALLDVKPSKLIDLKPWGSDVVDLMAKRWPRGGQMKLKDLSRIVGIPVPAGDVDGSQVEELLKTNPDKLGDYVRSDVSITREIYLMGRGFWW